MSRRGGDDSVASIVEEVEFVTYDPNELDTFPSVCHTPGEVKERFGFKGGETLIFDMRGNYVGQLVKQLPKE